MRPSRMLRAAGQTVAALGLLGASVGLCLAPAVALAQDPHAQPPHPGGNMQRPIPLPQGAGQGAPGANPHAMPGGPGASPHGAPPGAAPGANPHGTPQGAAGEHGGSGHGAAAGDHGGHHELKDINWFYGFIGEKEGASDHDILWRPKGTPIPLMANFINFAILAGAGVYLGRKPLADGLVKRRDDLEREMDEAAKVMAAAQARLDEYKSKLKGIDSEMARVRQDYAEQAKREKERILREAAEKRDRMKRDSEFLLEQESKLIRQSLLRETVDAATEQAETLVRKALTAQDQERFAEEFLKGFSTPAGSSVSGGAR